tara:strand:+ start:3499 stop:3615 length:117 start_codon:yes stop_codon:yes gene_type:complete
MGFVENEEKVNQSSMIYLNIYKSNYVIVSNMGDRFWRE